MALNTTTYPNSSNVPGNKKGMTHDKYEANFALYIGIGIGVGIVICVIIIVILVRHGRFRYLRGRSWSCVSTKKIFTRGFSTVSQRGVLDSTAEFEIIHTSSCPSESSDVDRESNKNRNAPRKPGRKKSQSSSASNKYENVMLDPNVGYVIRKSASMNSNIPYIDSTLDKKDKEEDEDNDDVFT